MQVTSIANFKGGTGKTVTACNMAALLAGAGFKTLLIDADPQHNASTFFGADPLAPTLTQLLTGEAAPVWSDVVSPAGRENLSLLPADMGLLALDLAAMQGEGFRMARRLRDFLDAVAQDEGFDHVVIDCPPSFTAATVAALLSTDWVILPTRLDAFSQAGVRELVGQVETLRGHFRRGMLLPGCLVLITMADRTRLAAQGEELLRASGLLVFNTVIRSSTKVGEATFARQPLGEYAPRCGAAEDYAAFVNEFLEVI